MTVAELAAFLGITPSGVRAIISRNKIKAAGIHWKAKLYDPRDVLRHAGTWDRLGGNRVCKEQDCSRSHVAHGWCSTHYQRWRKHGDPTLMLRPGVRAQGGYESAHQWVRQARGSALSHTCSNCGKPAEDWAYDHADLHERTEGVTVYSLDPEHYSPLCRACHKTLDLAF